MAGLDRTAGWLAAIGATRLDAGQGDSLGIVNRHALRHRRIDLGHEALRLGGLLGSVAAVLAFPYHGHRVAQPLTS